MNSISKVRFQDLYEMGSGISSTKEQAGHGAPFVSFSTVFNNYFLPDELPDKMDTSAAEQAACSVKAGDILLTRTSETIDELAMSCVATKDYPQATFSGFLKRLRPKTTGIAYDKYLAFYLRGDLFRRTITNNAFMTLRASFNEDIFSYLYLYLPPYEQQVLMGDLLYKMEQKIQLNKRICAELESMAKTLYDYWFVQFDFLDANGKPYRASGGEMVWNEQLKREIPKGWSVNKIGELLASIPNTVRIQTGEYNTAGKIPVIDQSTDFIAGYTDDDNSVLYSEHGHIVFGDHTRIVKYIRFPFARGADGTQIISSNDDRIPNELFYQAIKNIDLSNYGYARHFKFLKDTPVIVPTTKVAHEYINIVKSMYDKTVQLLFENIELSKLRDWLLPMLMNGQATVSPAESAPKLQVLQTEKAVRDPRFDRWLQRQGVAARGTVDEQTLHDIFDAMDDDDKQ